MLPDTSEAGNPSNNANGSIETMAPKDRSSTRAAEAVAFVNMKGANIEPIAPHTTIWRTMTRRAFGAPRIIQRNANPVIASANTLAPPTKARWRKPGFAGNSAAGHAIDKASAAGIHKNTGARQTSAGMRTGIGVSTMARTL